MEAIKITAYTTDPQQIEALKSVMKALNIKFELSEDISAYDPEFVEKINESRKQANQGEMTRIDKKDLKEFLEI